MSKFTIVILFPLFVVGSANLLAQDIDSGNKVIVPIVLSILDLDSETALGQCNNGIDDDGDGLVDWQQDPACTNRDSSEGGQNGSLKDGWTVFNPSHDSRIIYVSSSSGNDVYDGFSAEFSSDNHGPKRTLAAALALTRHNMPDWVLIKRGDNFSGNLNQFKSGRSASEPTVISSYGNSIDLPVIQGGIVFPISPVKNNVVVSHIKFSDNEYSHIGAFRGSNVLIEGCQFEGGNHAIQGTDVVEVTHKVNWKIRRNTIRQTEDSGFYFFGFNGLLIEENVIYRPSVAVGNHGMYITNGANEGIVTRGNMVFVGKTEGNAIMQRPGGIVDGNLVSSTGWSGIAIGSCDDDGSPPGPDCYPKSYAEVSNNIVVNSRWGILLNHPFVADDASVVNNLVIHSQQSNPNADIAIGVSGDANGVRIENNTIHDSYGMRIIGATEPNGLILRNNIFSETMHNVALFEYPASPSSSNVTAVGNRFYSEIRSPSMWFATPGNSSFSDWQLATGETGSDATINFVDSSRSIESYNRDIVGRTADQDDFFAEAVRQTKFNHRPEYTIESLARYLEDGFTLE